MTSPTLWVTVAASLAGMAQQMQQGGAQAGQQFGQNFQENWKSHLEDSMTSFEGAVRSMSSMGTAAMESLFTGYEPVPPDFNTFTPFFQSMESAVGNIGEKMVGWVPIVGDVAAGFVSSWTGAIQDVTGLVGSLGQTLYEIGNHWQETSRKILGVTGANRAELENYMRVTQQILASGDIVHMNDVVDAIGIIGDRMDNIDNTQLREFTTLTAQAQELLGNFNVAQMVATLNQWGVSSADAAKKTAGLVHVAQDTKIPFDVLNRQLIQSGPILQEFGLNLDQTAMFLGTLNKEGIDPQRFAYQFQRAARVVTDEGKPLKGALKDIFDTAKNLLKSDPTEQSAQKYLQEVFGPYGFARIIRVLKDGSTDIDAFTQSMTASTDVLNQDVGEIADQVNRTADLGEQFVVIRNRLIADLRVVGQGMADSLTQAGDNLQEWLKDHSADISSLGQEILQWSAVGIKALTDIVAGSLHVVAPFLNIVKEGFVLAGRTILDFFDIIGAAGSVLPDWLGGDWFKAMGDSVDTAQVALGKLNEIDLGHWATVAADGVDRLGSEIIPNYVNMATSAMQPTIDMQRAFQDLSDNVQAIPNTKTFRLQGLGIREMEIGLEKVGIKFEKNADGVVTKIHAANEEIADDFATWYDDNTGKELDLALIVTPQTPDGTPITDARQAVPMPADGTLPLPKIIPGMPTGLPATYPSSIPGMPAYTVPAGMPTTLPGGSPGGVLSPEQMKAAIIAKGKAAGLSDTEVMAVLAVGQHESQWKPTGFMGFGPEAKAAGYDFDQNSGGAIDKFLQQYTERKGQFPGLNVNDPASLAAYIHKVVHKAADPDYESKLINNFNDLQAQYPSLLAAAAASPMVANPVPQFQPGSTIAPAMPSGSVPVSQVRTDSGSYGVINGPGAIPTRPVAPSPMMPQIPLPQVPVAPPLPSYTPPPAAPAAPTTAAPAAAPVQKYRKVGEIIEQWANKEGGKYADAAKKIAADNPALYDAEYTPDLRNHIIKAFRDTLGALGTEEELSTALGTIPQPQAASEAPAAPAPMGLPASLPPATTGTATPLPQMPAGMPQYSVPGATGALPAPAPPGTPFTGTPAVPAGSAPATAATAWQDADANWSYWHDVNGSYYLFAKGNPVPSISSATEAPAAPKGFHWQPTTDYQGVTTYILVADPTKRYGPTEAERAPRPEGSAANPQVGEPEASPAKPSSVPPAPDPRSDYGPAGIPGSGAFPRSGTKKVAEQTAVISGRTYTRYTFPDGTQYWATPEFFAENPDGVTSDDYNLSGDWEWRQAKENGNPVSGVYVASKKDRKGGVDPKPMVVPLGVLDPYTQGDKPPPMSAGLPGSDADPTKPWVNTELQNPAVFAAPPSKVTEPRDTGSGAGDWWEAMLPGSKAPKFPDRPNEARGAVQSDNATKPAWYERGWTSFKDSIGRFFFDKDTGGWRGNPQPPQQPRTPDPVGTTEPSGLPGWQNMLLPPKSTPGVAPRPAAPAPSDDVALPPQPPNWTPENKLPKLPSGFYWEPGNSRWEIKKVGEDSYTPGARHKEGGWVGLKDGGLPNMGAEGFNEGVVPYLGPIGRDSVHAILEPDEFVVNRETAMKNKNELWHLNETGYWPGGRVGFDEGGYVNQLDEANRRRREAKEKWPNGQRPLGSDSGLPPLQFIKWIAEQMQGSNLPGASGSWLSGGPVGFDVGGAVPKSPMYGVKGAQKDTINLTNALNEMFPDVTNYNLYGPADGFNEHSTGQAVDAMVHKDQATGMAVKNFVMDHADAFGVLYAIWQNKMWYPGGRISDYGADPADKTKSHFDHVHIRTAGGGWPEGKPPLPTGKYPDGRMSANPAPGIRAPSNFFANPNDAPLGFKEGGFLDGQVPYLGPIGRDSVHAVLEPDEFVIKRAVAMQNLNELWHLNNTGQWPGATQQFNTGGQVLDTKGVQVDTIAAATAIQQAFGITDIGMYRSPDGYNEHSSGQAADVMVDAIGTTTPSGVAKGNQVNAWAMSNAGNFGIEYTIWQNKTWYPGQEPKDYGHDPNDITGAHMDHVHVKTLGGGYMSGNDPASTGLAFGDQDDSTSMQPSAAASAMISTGQVPSGSPGGASGSYMPMNAGVGSPAGGAGGAGGSYTGGYVTDPYTGQQVWQSPEDYAKYQWDQQGTQQRISEMQSDLSRSATEITEATQKQTEAHNEWIAALDEWNKVVATIQGANPGWVPGQPLDPGMDTSFKYTEITEKLTAASKKRDDQQQNLLDKQDSYDDKDTALQRELNKPPDRPKGSDDKVKPDQNAETLGKGFVSGIMQGLGFDGSVFENPMDWGIWKLFTGGVNFMGGLNKTMKDNGRSGLLGGPAGAGGGNTGGDIAGGVLNGLIPGVTDFMKPNAPGAPGAQNSIPGAMSPTTAPEPVNMLPTTGGGGGPTFNIQGVGLDKNLQNFANDQMVNGVRHGPASAYQGTPVLPGPVS